MTISVKSGNTGTTGIIQIDGSDALTFSNTGTISSTSAPGLFNNSTSTAATTSFVKASVGNYARYTSYNGVIVTLSESQIGGVFGLSGTPTITLPSASSVSAGSSLDFVVSDANTASLVCQGSDTINIGPTSSAVASFSMRSGETLRLVASGSGSWIAVDGNAAIRINNYVTSGTSASGYTRYPNGFIVAFGTVTIAASNPVTGTFPITFTQAPLVVINSRVATDVANLYTSPVVTTTQLSVGSIATGTGAVAAGAVPYVAYGF